MTYEEHDPPLVPSVFDLAAKEIGDLAAGRKQWRMCAPVQADDSDIVLMNAVRAGRSLLGDRLAFRAALRAAEDEAARLGEQADVGAVNAAKQAFHEALGRLVNG